MTVPLPTAAATRVMSGDMAVVQVPELVRGWVCEVLAA